jgi:hypothetical protein
LFKFPLRLIPTKIPRIIQLKTFARKVAHGNEGFKGEMIFAIPNLHKLPKPPPINTNR